MERRKLIEAFAVQRFSNGLFVVYPDHPLLARGPDLLARLDSGLIAVFFYTGPRTRPELGAEQSRILLSHFALPDDTEFWLVVTDESLSVSPDDLALFDSYFINFVPAKGSQVRERIEPGYKEALAVLKRFHMQRFAGASLPKSISRRYKREVHGPSVAKSRESTYRPKASWLRLDDDGNLVADMGSGGNRAQVSSRAQTFSIAATAIDFGAGAGAGTLFDVANVLETGHAHLPLHELRIDLAAHSHSRTVADVFKPLRTAAFAGAAVDYPKGYFDGEK